MSLSISTNNILQFFILWDRLSWGAFYSIPQTVPKRTELQPSTIINISRPTFKDFVVVLSLHPMTSKINCLCTRLSQINTSQIPVSGTVSGWRIKKRKIKGDNLYKVFSSVNGCSLILLNNTIIYLEHFRLWGTYVFQFFIMNFLRKRKQWNKKVLTAREWIEVKQSDKQGDSLLFL